MASFSSIGSILILLLIGVSVGNAQLSANFYSTTCPNVTNIVRAAVVAAVNNERRMGASLLRLHFHDCFVAGCDASVLLDDTATLTGEKTAGPNAGSLRGFDIIDTIKTQVEAQCPGIVSCADILTLAARDGTVALQGPSWAVALGRRDSLTASLAAANNGQLPGPGSSLAQLTTRFSNKGFNVRELVALSGSHTIGQARCVTFRNRIYNDANINAAFRTQQQANCPQTGGNNNLAGLDPSPVVFNNDYYTSLVGQRGLLHSDQELFNNATTDAQVRAYSTNAASFANDFAAAMIKMSNLSPLTGTAGQVRRNCRRPN